MVGLTPLCNLGIRCVSCSRLFQTEFKLEGQEPYDCCYFCYRLAMLVKGPWEEIIHSHRAFNEAFGYGLYKSHVGIPSEMWSSINDQLTASRTLRLYARWKPRAGDLYSQPRGNGRVYGEFRSGMISVMIDIPIPLDMTMVDVIRQVQNPKNLLFDYPSREAYLSRPFEIGELTQISCAIVPDEEVDESDLEWWDYSFMDNGYTELDADSPEQPDLWEYCKPSMKGLHYADLNNLVVPVFS